MTRFAALEIFTSEARCRNPLLKCTDWRQAGMLCRPHLGWSCQVEGEVDAPTSAMGI